MKRIIIVLSGQVSDDTGFLSLLEPRDILVCADGGARHLHRLGCLPDLLVGDLDSIDPVDLAWIEQHHVPIERFPSAKDQTDAELAIAIALEYLAKASQLAASASIEPDLIAPQGGATTPKNVVIAPQDVEIVILAALGGRPDHVLANQLMAVHLAEQGYHVLLSDGLSRLYPLAGPCHFELHLENDRAKEAVLSHPTSDRPLSWAVSAIPVSPRVTGLTYTGLSYPLVEATLPQGSCQGVSNRPLADQPITVDIVSGSLLLVITPEI